MEEAKGNRKKNGIFMGSGSKDRIKGRDYGAVSASNRTASKLKSERPGLMKRFFKWIARGSDHSRMSRASCPT
jgi:hypothetical protein